MLRATAILIAWVLLAIGGPRSADAAARSAPPPEGRCTAAQPCTIRVMFYYTQEGLAALQPRTRAEQAPLKTCYDRVGNYGICLLGRVARDNVAALRDAFLRSGITEVTAGRPNIVFAPAALPAEGALGVDLRGMQRIDVPSGWFNAPQFNVRLLNALPKAPLMRQARSMNLVVVFTGLKSPDGDCIANSVHRDGLILLPGCLTNGYLASPERAFGQQLLFLHEAGHAFGAFHNDTAAPQPCKDAAKAGFDPRSCAWETCTDRRCTPVQMAMTPNGFCTLTGQFNYGYNDTFCRAHRKGEMGSGWIREWSHPGKCRTRGWERWDCGDARHDAVSVMKGRVWRVAHSAAGTKR
jgi:hypothetical protein